MNLNKTQRSDRPQVEGIDRGVSADAALESEGDGVQADARLPLDIAFEIVKNERRRLILSHLRDAEESLSLGTLAEQIAAYENDVTIAELNAQQRKRVYIGLYQFHLPKMADAGVVDFNQDRGVVRLGENATELFAFIDAGESPRRNGHQYCLALSVGGGLAFAAASLIHATWVANAAVLALVVGVPLVAYALRDSTSAQ